MLHDRIEQNVRSDQKVVFFDASYAEGALEVVAEFNHTDGLLSSRFHDVLVQEVNGVIMVQPPAIGTAANIVRVGVVVVGFEQCQTGLFSDSPSAMASVPGHGNRSPDGARGTDADSDRDRRGSRSHGSMDEFDIWVQGAVVGACLSRQCPCPNDGKQ
jgi:hypothetical protein